MFIMTHLERILLPVLLLQQNLLITTEFQLHPHHRNRPFLFLFLLLLHPSQLKKQRYHPPPPITYVPFSTIPLSSPIITESKTTTIPEPPEEVNVSDPGATPAPAPPHITKPHSPTNSTDSGATPGGGGKMSILTPSTSVLTGFRLMMILMFLLQVNIYKALMTSQIYCSKIANLMVVWLLKPFWILP